MIDPIKSGFGAANVQTKDFMNIAKLSDNFQTRLINHAMIGGKRDYDNNITSRAHTLGKIFTNDPAVMSVVHEANRTA